ncbi:hypothetical protein K438DRAFT_1938785 [Mycena galopus ATCC 62051]|nr:hypothetical protein K438DRAFT_1938785 [Mycena galopus ATCC 62051]
MSAIDQCNGSKRRRSLMLICFQMWAQARHSSSPSSGPAEALRRTRPGSTRPAGLPGRALTITTPDNMCGTCPCKSLLGRCEGLIFGVGLERTKAGLMSARNGRNNNHEKRGPNWGSRVQLSADRNKLRRKVVKRYTSQLNPFSQIGPQLFTYKETLPPVVSAARDHAGPGHYLSFRRGHQKPISMLSSVLCCLRGTPNLIHIGNLRVESLSHTHRDLPLDMQMFAQLIVHQHIVLATVPVNSGPSQSCWDLEVWWNIPKHARIFSIAVLGISTTQGTRLLGSIKIERGEALLFEAQETPLCRELMKVNVDGPTLQLWVEISVITEQDVGEIDSPDCQNVSFYSSKIQITRKMKQIHDDMQKGIPLDGR